MSKVFVTADLHIGHERIIEYCNRPFKTIEEMDNTLVNNWNSIVGNDDTVYLLGDYVLLKRHFKFHLNGNIILIKGNHDRLSNTKLYDLHISKIHKKPIYLMYGEHSLKLMHSPLHNENSYINLCGHVHQKWKFHHNCYNVGVDVHDFKPILLDEAIKNWMSYQEK